MRFLFFILLIFSSNLSFSQSKISVDAVHSVDRGFRILGEGENSRVLSKNENDFKKYGFRAGININYSPIKKISLKTGFRWVKSGYGTKTENENFIYHYFEIPLTVRYYYGKRRLRWFTELGIGFHQYRKGNTNPVVIMRKWNKVALAGFGVDFDYSPELAFFLNPLLRYHLDNTFRSNDEPEENLYNSGLEMGFRVKF